MIIINETYTKLNPYELCPCRSGKKFKFCCLNKARETKKRKSFLQMKDARIENKLLQSWKETNFEECLFNNENCKGRIKAAHSVQNNRILNRISEAGHLYTIEGRVNRGLFKPDFKKISKNKASTFTGFCDYHDNVIFKPIETGLYEDNKEQNFLFSYRSFCIAYHKIVRRTDLFIIGVKENPAMLLYEEAVIQYRTNQLDLSEGKSTLEKLNNLLEKREFTSLKYFTYTLNFEVNFAVASYFAIKEDMNGNIINDIYNLNVNNIVPRLFMNVLPIENKTIIIIAYDTSESQKYDNLFRQFESSTEENLLKFFNYIIINYTEDIYFRPSNIDNLNEIKKKSILDSFESYTNIATKFELLATQQYFKFNIFDI